MSPISSAAAPDAEVDPVSRFVGALRGYERLLRSAYAAGGQLATAAAEAHADRDLGALSGHQIMAAFGDANIRVTEAMARAAEGHRMLEKMARAMGIDPKSYGDIDKPPQSIFTPTGAAD